MPVELPTFKARRFKKVGNNKTECLNAEWKEVGKSIPMLKNTYKDTILVLNKIPPAYKKHYILENIQEIHKLIEN